MLNDWHLRCKQESYEAANDGLMRDRNSRLDQFATWLKKGNPDSHQTGGLTHPEAHLCPQNWLQGEVQVNFSGHAHETLDPATDRCDNRHDRLHRIRASRRAKRFIQEHRRPDPPAAQRVSGESRGAVGPWVCLGALEWYGYSSAQIRLNGL